MELKINIGYANVWELVNQLSDSDIRKLMEQIQCKFDNSEKKTIPMQELILQAPTWTDEEYNNYLEVRKQINQSRLK